MFDCATRMAMIREDVELAGLKNVSVEKLDTLLVDFCRTRHVSTVIRGVRVYSDFEYEFQMALINHKLNPGLDTMFLTTEHQFMYLSSSAVKELARYDADVSDFLPAAIIPDFKARMMEQI
mgnify:CR=1 FL=1